MARSKSTLSRLIDKSMGRLLEKRGKEGFGYEEILISVRTELGSTLEATLQALGEEQLRAKIRDRASKIATGDLKGPIFLHPRLDLGDAAVVYPVKQGDGVTKFKKVTHLTEADMAHVISVLIGQRKGLTRHIQSLRKMERVLKPHWRDHPDWTVEEIQVLLDREAA